MKKYLIIIFVVLGLMLFFLPFNDEKGDTAGTSEPIGSTVQTETSPIQTSPPPAVITAVTSITPEIQSEENYENPIVKTAEALIGIDFSKGGASPSEGFDNSGFIYYVLRENGYIGCPRQISAQLEWGENVGFDDIKAGDILYFSEEIGGRAGFGGIYAGGGVMIYSPYPGEKVKKPIFPPITGKIAL